MAAMSLSDFDYDLPETLVAQQPLARRDQARLLVVDRQSERITHSHFYDLPRLLPVDSNLVVNCSRVVPARLLGVKERSGGKVEVFLLKKFSDGTYEALLRPMRRLKDGDVLVFGDKDLQATVVDKDKRRVRFNRKDVRGWLEKVGHIPLPPYIKRTDRPSDRKDYQTVYARYPGSVASPTAGLHFTAELLHKLRAEGRHIEQVMLHVNYATFKPVEVEDIKQHPMHEEEYSISEKTYSRLRSQRRNGRRIVAVGTTSCRVLESAAAGKLKGKTRLFIYPGYRFRFVDALITNFHLPRSTLLMLVSAFAGTGLIKKAYQQAIQRQYRFYSYGDAMLIL